MENEKLLLALDVLEYSISVLALLRAWNLVLLSFMNFALHQSCITFSSSVYMGYHAARVSSNAKCPGIDIPGND